MDAKENQPGLLDKVLRTCQNYMKIRGVMSSWRRAGH